MKQNWEYKKLGDVCEIVCGQDYKSVQDDNGPYPIYGTGGIMGYASQYRCPEGSVIVGRKGSINNPLYVETKFWNVDTAFGIVPNGETLQSKFFFYFCRQYDFTKHDVSVTIPSLRRTDIMKIDIPVPPMSEQERIVAELDLLNGVLEKQKAQLKELDTLAQSIFYDMFGDPIENPKGWEERKLGDVSRSITDGDHMPPPKSKSGIPFITISDVDKDSRSIDFSSTYYVPQEYYDKIKENRKAEVGDVLYTVTGSYGIPILVKENRIFCFQRHIALIKLGPDLVAQFLCYWALCASVKAEADKVATGIAQKTVGLNSIRNFSIILPPLSLQQVFADKIASIEKQKASINQSIAETQKLLDYTMDKYFG